MTHLFHDYETFSECDIKKHGAYRYSEDGSTQVLMCAYAFNDREISIWQSHESSIPAELREALEDPGVIKHAHNANFERLITQNVIGIPAPPKQYRCSAVLARSLGLPGQLGNLCKAIKIDAEHTKLASGTRLINKFSKPYRDGRRNHTTDPEDWQQFVDYCIRDVEAERAVYNKLKKWDLSDSEWVLWFLDQRINDRGLPVDLELVNAVQEMDREHREYAIVRLSEITGLANPNSRDQLLEWLNDHDANLKGLRKQDVESALIRDLPPLVTETLHLRKETALASVKKFQAFIDRTSIDGQLKGSLMFNGAARTGRWAGRGVQIQNLSRGSVKDIDTAIGAVKARDHEWLQSLYSNVPATLGSLTRPAICAPDGKVLVVCDYSSIEARVLPWLAKDEKTMEIFRSGRDIYKEAASGIYNLPADQINKEQRFIGKISVLACGYQGGANAYKSMSANYGVEIEEEKTKQIVSAWRQANPSITQLWLAVERAAKVTVIQRDSCMVRSAMGMTCVTFSYDHPFLRCTLPSGRAINYYKPKIENVQSPWGIREQLTFEGTNTYTRRWERVPTFGGKLVENIVQAISRDLLAHALLLVDQTGMEIVGHVHDEIICLADNEDETALNQLTRLMTTNSEWADGLPLRAEGWIGKRYRK